MHLLPTIFRPAPRPLDEARDDVALAVALRRNVSGDVRFDGTDRRAMHLAQVLKMTHDAGPSGHVGGFPEVRYPSVDLNGPERLKKTLRTAAIGGGMLLAGVAIAAFAGRLAKNQH